MSGRTSPIDALLLDSYVPCFCSQLTVLLLLLLLLLLFLVAVLLLFQSLGALLVWREALRQRSVANDHWRSVG